jgi:hypothetical protein
VILTQEGRKIMRKGVELTLGMDIDRFEPGVLVVTPGSPMRASEV